MPSSSHCHSDQESHQQGLGQFFANLIGFAIGKRRSARRARLNIRDLPASLRQDIGFEDEGTETSFEEKWRQELKRLQR